MFETVQHLTHLTTITRPRVVGRAVGYRSVLVLAVAAPAIAELLSGSCPPLLFFIPWIFVLFVLFYGGSAILIRELTVRWKTGWIGVLSLGAAFGILHEGLATRAFFDPQWRSLGPMVDHGRWLGVNWIWTADAILYHAVFSTALPLLFVYQLFPASRTEPWLGRRGLWVVGLLFASAAAVFLDSGKTRYPATSLALTACVVAILVLLVLARTIPAARPRRSRPTPTHPRRFAMLGASAGLALVLQIYVLPVAGSPWITAACFMAGVWTSGWLFLRWSRGGLTLQQECGLLTGAFGFFAVLGFFQEVNPARTDNPAGMSLVGAGTLVLLYFLWRRAVNTSASIVDRQLPVAVADGGGALVSTAASAYSYRARTASAGAAYAPELTVGERMRVLIPRRARVSVPQRVFECVFAATALVLTVPIMLAMAIVIRRGTPGGALFFQTRLGVNRQPFVFVKFRTLYADARQRFPDLYAYQYNDEELRSLIFKITNDPRVTPQGRWMRTTTLDELPNFWNVLRGDMALVGPRPEIPEMLPYYTGEMLQKFSVRPGITGLAQISGRGRLGFFETVKLDVEYVKTRSWIVDLKILLLTASKLLTRDGAF